MARVDSFQVVGLTLWFNSHDHHPPHFHAEKTDEWEVRVYFVNDEAAMFEMVWPKNAPIPQGALRELMELTKTHRSSLLAEFETKVNVKEILKQADFSKVNR